MDNAEALAKLAAAAQQHRAPAAPLNYASPPRAVRPSQPITIQQTSKAWKLQKLLAVGLVLLVAPCLWIAGVLVTPFNPTASQVFAVAGLLTAISGIAWFIAAWIGAWWHHG